MEKTVTPGSIEPHSFMQKFPVHYSEAPVDYFDGCTTTVDLIRTLDRQAAIAFTNDFIAACQQCGPLRGVQESAVIVVPGNPEYSEPPEVIAITIKEDNNGCTRTFSKYPLPWKEPVSADGL